MISTKKKRFLIITFEDLDSLISSAIIRKYITNKESPEEITIQSLYNGPDIITSLSVLKNKYLNYDFYDVYFLNMHHNKGRLKLYLDFILQKKISVINDTYVIDHLSNRYQEILSHYTFPIYEFHDGFDLSTQLSHDLGITLPEKLQEFIINHINYPDVKIINDLVNAYASDSRMLTAIEKYLFYNVIDNEHFIDPKTVPEFEFIFIEFYAFLDNKDRYFSEYATIKNNVIIFNRDPLYSSSISDKFITLHLKKYLHHRDGLYLITDSDNRVTYIRLFDKDDKFATTRICRDCNLACRGNYTYLTPDEIIRLIERNPKYDYLLNGEIKTYKPIIKVAEERKLFKGALL